MLNIKVIELMMILVGCVMYNTPSDDTELKVFTVVPTPAPINTVSTGPPMAALMPIFAYPFLATLTSAIKRCFLQKILESQEDSD